MTEKQKMKKSKKSVSIEEIPSPTDNLGEIDILRRELEQLKGTIKPTETYSTTEEEEDDYIVQKIRIEPKKEKGVTPLQLKKERSQKQIEQFQKAVEARKASITKRAELRKEAEEKAQKILEEKILKKAIRVKKKQIKQLQVYEPTSSEEEIEEEEQIIRPKPRGYTPSDLQSKPKYSFI